jgi:hypothetical protein
MTDAEPVSGPASACCYACSRPPSAAVLIGVAGCILALTLGAVVHAADDAGIYDFLRSQAQQGGSETAPSARLRETRTSQPKASTAVGRRIPRAAVRHVREAHQERTKEITRSAPRQPRMRYASLPRDEEQAAPQKAKVRPPVTTTRPKAQPLSRPIETGSDPVAALLRDPTLRPGDIVVFPDGPRVFKGSRVVPHRVDMFESVEHSRLVSKASRKALMVMAGQVPTMGKEARQHLPAALSSVASTATQAEARTETVRVVYPSATR